VGAAGFQGMGERSELIFLRLAHARPEVPLGGQSHDPVQSRPDAWHSVTRVQIGGGFEPIHQHLGSSASLCLDADFVGWADLTGMKLLAVATDAQKKTMLHAMARRCICISRVVSLDHPC